MPKSFKYRLYPNQEQKEKLEKTLETCRILYNDFLAERRDKYEKEQKKITCFEQINPFLKEVHSQILQDVARRVNKSFQDFFRRLKPKQAKPVIRDLSHLGGMIVSLTLSPVSI